MNLNTTIYIFGKFINGFTQYPDDSTRDFLEHVADLEVDNGKTQMVIHRNGDLMYYAFVKKLTDTNKSIGICFVWNGVKCNSILQLNQLCIKLIGRWTMNGDIVEVSEKGDIVSTVGQLYDYPSLVNNLSIELSNQIDGSQLSFSKLLPINYGNKKEESKSFKLKQVDDEIINEAIDNYSYVYVGSNLQYLPLNSAAAKLKESANKIEECRKEIMKLQQENELLIRKKKQTKTVAILAVLLMLMLIPIPILIVNSNEKSNDIDNLRADRRQKQDLIVALKQDTTYYCNQIRYLNSQYKELENINSRLSYQNDRLYQDNLDLNEQLKTSRQTVVYLRQQLSRFNQFPK